MRGAPANDWFAGAASATRAARGRCGKASFAGAVVRGTERFFGMLSSTNRKQLRVGCKQPIQHLQNGLLISSWKLPQSLNPFLKL